MDGLLEIESEFYAKHKAEFEEKYPGKYLLIHGAELHGAYSSEDDAGLEGYRKFGRGPFFVRKSGAGPMMIHNPALSLGIINARF